MTGVSYEPNDDHDSEQSPALRCVHHTPQITQCPHHSPLLWFLSHQWQQGTSSSLPSRTLPLVQSQESPFTCLQSHHALLVLLFNDLGIPLTSYSLIHILYQTQEYSERILSTALLKVFCIYHAHQSHLLNHSILFLSLDTESLLYFIFFQKYFQSI